MKDIETWIYETSFTAGMNQQYDQYMLWWCDAVLWAVFAVLLYSLIVAFCRNLSSNGAGRDYLPYVLTCIACVAFIACLATRAGYARAYNDWCDVRFAVDSLTADASPDEVLAIRKKIAEIEKRESAPFESILDWCYDCECKRRGVENPYKNK